jgi:hypothetical protein
MFVRDHDVGLFITNEAFSLPKNTDKARGLPGNVVQFPDI